MYTFQEIFYYSQNKPLLFTQFLFWIFFFVLMLGYSLIYKTKRLKLAYIMVFSLFFYYKCAGYFFFLLLFSTLFDFGMSHLIHRAQKKPLRLFFLTCSIIVNIGLLCFFKYFAFFTGILNNALDLHIQPFNFLAAGANMIGNTHFDVGKIILPVGISFFTFQTISYAVDVYRRKIMPAKNILDFGFFVTFFPQLVAGPIVRAADFLPQIYKKYELTLVDFNRALYLILNGLMKKIMISDYISVNFVDRVFDNPKLYSGFENLMAVFGYSMQIYCDFSGYTDIAIGLALLIGFRLPLNFNAPFKSANVTEFWRRWHISLSTWLTDYLFVPIATATRRWGKMGIVFALFITFFLSGLWHGAGWTFIIFGCMHGLAMIFEFLTSRLRKKTRKIVPHIIYHPISVIITYLFVCFTWMFFRSHDFNTVFVMLDRIGNHFNWDLIPAVVQGYYKIFALIVLAFLIHMMPGNWKNGIIGVFMNTPLPLKAVAISVIVILLYQLTSLGVQPFIYFQF
jgi:alginate O-acetyltransferase complex protein AlgI